MTTIPRSVQLYVVTLVMAALTGLALSWFVWPGHSGSWWSIAYLAILFWVCASLGIQSSAGLRTSTSFAVGMAAVLLTGPLGAGLVGLLDGAQLSMDKPNVFKRLFNSAQFSLAGLAAGGVYELVVGGPDTLLDKNIEVAPLLFASALVTATYYLVNATLVSVAVSKTEGTSLMTVWWGGLSWAAVSYLAYGVFGLLMAVLWVEISVLAGALVLVPLFVARWTFAQYAAEHAAYDATVRALIQSVETKDYYTRGHSERVSKATVMIAREWGMREDRVNVIRYAGMLHDVGKLGVPTKVLQKQGKLNDAEYDAIKLHPMRGYEMLREITFLEEALTGVVHHHERMDGRGYPMGLVGTEIPEFARIIMVADAFDSMTSTRSYRAAKSVEEAVGELHKWQGAQFDETAVAALVRAIEKHGWDAQPEEFHGELVARDGTLLPRPTGVPMSASDDAQSSMPKQAS